jgi:hypothetical protein
MAMEFLEMNEKPSKYRYYKRFMPEEEKDQNSKIKIKKDYD